MGLGLTGTMSPSSVSIMDSCTEIDPHRNARSLALIDSARPADDVLGPRTQIGPRTYSARQANSRREEFAPGY